MQPRQPRKRSGATKAAEVPAAVVIKAASGKTIAKANKLLDKMRANPQGDWQIADFERVADLIGVRLTQPTRGSHYKASSDHLPGILTIPAKKPIIAPYVKQFVAMCRTHMERSKESKDVR